MEATTDAWGDLVSEYDGVDTLYHQYDALGTTDSLMDDTESTAARYAHRAFGVEESFTGTSDNSFTVQARLVAQATYAKVLDLLGSKKATGLVR